MHEGLTPQELDESRRYLVGSIPRALETNAAIANFLQTEEFFGLGLDYDVRLPEPAEGRHAGRGQRGGAPGARSRPRDASSSPDRVIGIG